MMLFGRFRNSTKGAKTNNPKSLRKVASTDSLSSLATATTATTASVPQQDLLDDITSIGDSTLAERRASVSFNEDLNEHHYNDFALEDLDSIWYTKDDYIQFKEAVKEKVDQARAEQTGSNQVKKTFFLFLRGMHSSSKLVKRLRYNADSLLTPRQQQYLHQLYGNTNNHGESQEEVDEETLLIDWIGLETQIIAEIKQDGHQSRRKVRAALQRVERECDRRLFKREALPSERRVASVPITLSHVMFAQLLAKAQAGQPLTREEE